jgi:osmoprotectant transport system permease protein
MPDRCFANNALALLLAATMSLPASAGATEAPGGRVVVGAKKFTESVVLAELMAQVLESHADLEVERRFNLAGTQVCFDALRNGDIDLYAEYTGTGLRNILHATESAGGAAATYARVSAAFRRRFDLVWLAPFGFNNTYVLVMRRDRAAALGIAVLSDLKRAALRYGVSHEFLQRPDGMPGLRRIYGLREAGTVGMEHDLAYRALGDGSIDVSDGYSTDAKLGGSDLVALRDDLGFFPPYEAAPLTRREVIAQNPRVATALALLAGRIDDLAMRQLNHRVEGERLSPAQVAAEFLRANGLRERDVDATPRSASFLSLLWQRREVTLSLAARHLTLTIGAVLAACAVAIPLGIAASRRPRLAAAAMATAGVLQTIPSIALLAFMLPFFGVGVAPAMAALFLYGLLPILRNTVAGLQSVDPELVDVGRGLGMRPWQVLWHVELPLSAAVILAGVRTSTVINIGTATLAAFIGAGGLGDPIVTGLSVTDTNLVLCGALPAAALAIGVDGVLAGVEWVATPRGLRVRRAERS